MDNKPSHLRIVGSFDDVLIDQPRDYPVTLVPIAPHRLAQIFDDRPDLYERLTLNNQRRLRIHPPLDWFGMACIALSVFLVGYFAWQFTR